MRIYLAGTSILKDEALLEHSKYTLESFVYVKPWQFPYIRRHRDTFMLDSGAFTFMMNAKTSPDWPSYIDKLAEFITENDVKLWCEIDVDYVLGYDKVREFRRLLENKTSRPSIPVWHIPRGLEDFKAHCRDYSYLAIGSAPKDITMAQHCKMLDIANEYGCRIHELGRTGMGFLRTVRPFSADSTSWQAASRNGHMVTFKNGRIVMKKDPNIRIKQKENTLRAFEQWLKFQAYADRFL